MTYQEAIKFLETPKGFGAQTGLDRMREFMHALGDPQDDLKVIHVAGSNGKGSTSSMIASILMTEGYKVGLYTSPHLKAYNERVKIDGISLTDEEVAKYSQIISKAADSISDYPTVFERLTALGFYAFKDKKCDFVVLEVGLGGRLDATNIIKTPLVSVIAHLALEHTKILGNTLEQIATEKGGIIKQSCPTVIMDQDKAAIDTIKEICKQRNSKLYITEPNKTEFIKSDLDGQVFNYKNRQNISLSLLGTYQRKNSLLALDAIDVLKEIGFVIKEESIYKGLETAYWPARFQIIKREPLMIVDGAHNPDGVKELCQSLKTHLPGKKFIFMMGVMADKKYNEMLDIICPLGKEFVCIKPDEKRGLEAADLADIIQNRYNVPSRSANSVEEGIKLVLEAQKEDDIVIFFGSLYQAGDVLKYFNIPA